MRNTLGQSEADLVGALGELAMAGFVTADSFAGIRALLRPSAERTAVRSRRRRNHFLESIEDAGRWELLPRHIATNADDLEPDSPALETLVKTVLRRYGVVFKRVLERESALPAWRYVLWCLRRLEARGEVRGGRFVDGFSGEQFALPEAVESLRRMRRDMNHDGRLAVSPQASRGYPSTFARHELTIVNGADPLNLSGIIVPGARVPALHSNQLVFQGGEVVAVSIGRNLHIKSGLAPDLETRIRTAIFDTRAQTGRVQVDATSNSPQLSRA